MADVRDVAKYFLMIAAGSEEDAGEAITHLKLQKLLYYGQGFCLAIVGEPLFNAPIEAWRHGPVVRAIRDIYREYGANPIHADPNFEPARCLSEDENGLLGDVWNTYGQFSAWKLRNMTHEEPPWKDAYRQGENTVISHESLRRYFETQIEP